jgi:hypothetical protein
MSGYATAPSGNKRPFIMRVGKNYLSDLVDGMGGYPGDYPGAVYFVDNTTAIGASTNDGLSWEHPFAEITQAIDASQALHALGGKYTYARNVIYVKGTATGYAVLTELDSDITIIGVGRSPYGNGAGIPLIGTVTGGTTTPVTSSATVRGVEFYNMQFAFGSGSTNGVLLSGAFLRGKFENCSFLCSGTASTGACLNVTSTFAGNLVRHCQFSGDAGYPAYGIYLADSITMNNNIFEDNIIIGGTTAAVYVGASVNDVNTIWRNNLIGASQANNSTKGFDDNGPGYSFVFGNYVIGADAIEETTAGHVLGNYTMDGTTPGFEEDISNF